MRERGEWRTALAMLGAASGVGLASGREIALFLAQMKSAAWAGVLAASALYGLLTGGAARFRQTAVRSGPEALCEGLRLLLAALVAAFMLYRLGRLGALTLPLRHGYGFGAGFGLLAALAMERLKPRGQARLGLAVALVAGLFFLANALDPRPARLHMSGAVELTCAGNYAAALLMAVPYAALTACAGVWRLRRLGLGAAVRPGALAVKSAALLCSLLSLAVWALFRAGDAVMAQPMPWVVLSARWGLAGFYLCAGLQAVCAAQSLAVALGLFMGRLERGGTARVVGALALALTLFCALSWNG